MESCLRMINASHVSYEKSSKLTTLTGSEGLHTPQSSASWHPGLTRPAVLFVVLQRERALPLAWVLHSMRTLAAAPSSCNDVVTSYGAPGREGSLDEDEGLDGWRVNKAETLRLEGEWTSPQDLKWRWRRRRQVAECGAPVLTFPTPLGYDQWHAGGG